MLTWRAFAASALFAIALFSPHAALAQNHQLHVPVSLAGLPPTLDRFSGLCSFRDAAGTQTHYGRVDRVIGGGRLVETVTFDMAPNPRAGEPDSYSCTFFISGSTERGERVQFRSDGSQSALGWRSVYEPGVRGFYLPAARATMISRAIWGQFEKAEQTAAPPPSTGTECPCGCTADGGARACSTDASPPPAPPASSPSAPPPLRLPETVSRPRIATPSPPPIRVGAVLPTTRINLTTSRFAYTGTGVTVVGP
jgi:hypothetical protein